MQFDIQKFLVVQILFLSLSMNAMDPGEELQAASSSGDGPRVQELLDSGANPDGNTAFSPLFTALLNEQDEVVGKLLDGGATIDQEVFVLAAQLGNVAILDRGLQNPDIDINAPAADLGVTALARANLCEPEELKEEIKNWLRANGATD